MKIELNNKALLGIALLSSSLVFAEYDVLIDAKSAGGIIVQKEEVPVGTVAMWGSSTPPENWIEMDGQSTGAYPELAAIYGASVPDLRGEFVRG